MKHACPTLKIDPTQDNILVKEDDIINNSLNDTLPSIYFDGIYSKDEVFMNHACPLPKLVPLMRIFWCKRRILLAMFTIISFLKMRFK